MSNTADVVLGSHRPDIDLPKSLELSKLVQE